MDDATDKKRLRQAEGDDADKISIYQTKKWEHLKRRSTAVDAPVSSGLKEKCMLWTGGDDGKGYGQGSYRGSKISVHRISYMIHHGIECVPKANEAGRKLQMRHLCNVSLCFEPTHLALGTAAEDGQDKSANGKLRGEKNCRAKITEATAAQIKLSKPLGLSGRDAAYETAAERAGRFNVSTCVVESIDCGGAWAFLPFADGTTSENAAQVIKATKKKRTALLKTTPWTNEQWVEAKEKLLDPAYSRVHPTRTFAGVPCREWLRAKNVAGYGFLSIHGGSIRAHIAACTIANNNVRPKDLEVAHRCGFTSCVEPAHLRFSTHAENMQDAVLHGRMKKKVSDAQAKDIREAYAKGNISQATLAKKYGVDQSLISLLVNKKIRADI